MGRCLDCELVGDSCICARVDKLFEEGRDAEMKAKSNLLELEPDFWFITRSVGVAMVTALFLVGTSCSLPQGADGQVGPAGPQGSPGAPAEVEPSPTPCTVSAVPGGAQVTCPDGSTQVVLNGANGVDGLPGTQVTAVQLCSGYDTTYPTSFPEYAMCAQDNLYGVFWTGSQAFWALMAPGTYNSTSPQGCTFTVGPHCQVTK